MRFSRHARLLLAGAAVVALAGPAYSLDGQDLLRKINGSYMSGGGTLAATAVEVNGDAVTLRGATFTPNAPDATAIVIGDLALTGVVAGDDGSYKIDRASFPEIDVTEDKTRLSVKDLYLAGVRVPATATGETLDSMPFYDKAHVGAISVVEDGVTVIAAKEGETNLSLYEDASGIDFDASLTGLQIDLSVVKDPKDRETIEKLGLQMLKGEFSMAGSWQVDSGDLSVDDYTLDFDKVGRLDLSFGIGGYTMKLLKQFQETAKTMQEKPNDQQVQQAASLTMLGLMQQLSFTSAEISFTDDGITKRGLDFAGTQQNMSGEQMGQMVKAMVPLMLAQYNLADLQNKVSEAVNTFIDDPQSFTVSAEPDKPVPFPMIMGAAMGAPETLPKVLGVTVSANE